MTPPQASEAAVDAHAMTAQAGAVAAAERDARTIYDIACIREARPDATREDVDFKAIALRNWQHVTAAVPVEALEGLVGNWKRFAEARGGADPVADDQRPGLAIAADELTTIIKERSNG